MVGPGQVVRLLAAIEPHPGSLKKRQRGVLKLTVGKLVVRIFGGWSRLEFAAFALLESSYPKFSYLQNDVGSGEWLGGPKLLVCWRPSNLTRAHSRSDNAEF